MLFVPDVPVPPFTANEVFPNLWQGSAPPVGDHLRSLGFTHLALCAMEYQPTPPELAYPGLNVFYAPNDDNFVDITDSQLNGAVKTATRIAQAILDGGKAIVTCREGKNRSGLVDALVIHILTGDEGWMCVRRVQQNRPRALRSPVFIRSLNRLQAGSPRLTLAGVHLR